MVFTPLLFLLAVGLLIWLVTQWPGRPSTDGAIEVARTRLAVGELTAEQFDMIQRTLGPPTAAGSRTRGFVARRAANGTLLPEHECLDGGVDRPRQ